jgi:hypothetical protein
MMAFEIRYHDFPEIRYSCGNELAPLPIQVVAVIAEFITVRAILPLILRYLTTQRIRIVVVIDAICGRLVYFINGIEIGCCWHGSLAEQQSCLLALGSFGSCDVFPIAVTEQANMLVAHKVTPFTISSIIDNGTKRAEVWTSLRLAAFRFGRLMFDAIERCGITHVRNNRRSSDQR